jgi:hypothetical protein
LQARVSSSDSLSPDSRSSLSCIDQKRSREEQLWFLLVDRSANIDTH